VGNTHSVHQPISLLVHPIRVVELPIQIHSLNCLHPPGLLDDRPEPVQADGGNCAVRDASASVVGQRQDTPSMPANSSPARSALPSHSLPAGLGALLGVVNLGEVHRSSILLGAEPLGVELLQTAVTDDLAVSKLRRAKKI